MPAKTSGKIPDLIQCSRLLRGASLLFFLLLSTIIFTAPVHSAQSAIESLKAGSQVQGIAPTPTPVAESLPAERVNDLPGLHNVGKLSPGLYRGAQPTREGYDTLKKMGIKTVINLCSSGERKVVEAAGMHSVEIPLSVLKGDRQKVDRIVALMADPANTPVFVHCKLGRDRTGIAVAAYRMKIQGWTRAAAEAEMESFGFNDIWVSLRHFLHDYAADLERTRQAKQNQGTR